LDASRNNLIVVPAYCDVALPVPLDRMFTYAVNPAQVPAVGARVIVPFSGQKLMGVVMRLHDDALPEGVEAKPVQAVMDMGALLSPAQMDLAQWIAAYYCAPLGEVVRGMLPLAAEVKRQCVYRIGEQGRKVLYEGAAKGSSRRSRLTPEEQNREYAVLNYLEAGDAAKAGALRSATGAGRWLLEGMVKKKWLVREAVAEARDARRMVRVAVLGSQVSVGASEPVGRRLPELNENQLKLMAHLEARGGRVETRQLKALGVPDSTLGTLVKRGLVAVQEVPEEFLFGGTQVAGKKQAHEHTLNEEQMEAAAAIAGAMGKDGFRALLLYGVTGSGKTAVYFAAMRRALDAGKGCLLLVPEIGLTPAMSGQLVAAFEGEVALLHSGLTPDERAEQWHRIRRGEARVVVGTRSAVFAPVRHLGLVIVDEEHDGSYKQEESPRYHGRDVAVMRAKLEGAVVVLGSATPSLESWSNADKGRYELVRMAGRVAGRALPKVEMVDMRAEFREVGKEEIFSRRLVQETRAALDRGEQVLLLLNRRGYSFVVICRSCGEKVECENCAIAMTYHRANGSGLGGQMAEGDGAPQPGTRLECHYCGFRRGVPKVCPKCASEHLYFLGAGSQQGEEKLQELFPDARIGRMDRDTVRGRFDMERLLARLHAGEINLLVGTQMMAKGHDIHGVTLVGVVGADHALGLPDFRAAERVFQLLTQVSGRAGRGVLAGKVLVQTYHTEHYAVQFAARHDYTGFVGKEMSFRRSLHYPPFSVLANVLVQSDKLEEAAGWAAQLGRFFEREKIAGVKVLGPAAAPIVKLKRIYRFHLIVKAQQRKVLNAALHRMLRFIEQAGISRRAVVVDVDAVSLM
jgi:primosomal protein N' (replication factor Y)